MSNPSNLHQRIKVCFIGLYTYPLFNPDCVSPFGGSEVRVSILAKELAHRGNVDVSVITFDHGQPPTETRDSVQIISWTGWHCPETVQPQALKKNTPAIKIFNLAGSILRRVFHLFEQNTSRPDSYGEIGSHSISFSRIAMYDKADADIYIIPGNAELSAELAYYCRKKGKKFVLLAGSDIDFNPEIKSNSRYATPYGTRGFLMQYTIDHADCFVLQTERQRRVLHENFQKDGVIIRNPMDPVQKLAPTRDSKIILWVGKSDHVKRPKLVLELAENFPEYIFTLIMSFSSQTIHTEILARSKHMSNIIIKPYIPYNEIEVEYAKAGLLINTSLFEGFPNTFLQAAKYGVPILSLNVDPNGMLTEYGCGRFCNGDFEAMKLALPELVKTDNYAKASANGLDYVRKYHDKTLIAEQFEKALLSLFPNAS